MTYDDIVRGLRDSTRELHDEGRLVRAGLKTEQDTAAIVERYAWLYSHEALDVVGEPADEAGRRVRAAVLQGLVDRRGGGPGHARPPLVPRRPPPPARAGAPP